MNCRVLLAQLFLGVLTISASAQDLPRDTSVREGKLDNGFRYFIKKNKKPENRAVLYLVNKVGSILEEENERGLAHFLEHMNFKGTKNFPKNELIDYLEKSGVRFGADLNAYTSFDQTVYQLPIPTDDPELWQNGLKIMRDWTSEALLEKEEFEKERGVILEEKRLQQNAQGRMSQQYMPTLYNYSRYAERLPIGLDEVIAKVDISVLHDFYKRWYRPDLQALVIVGDIDVNKVEHQVKALFADLKNPQHVVERPQYPINLIDSLRFLQVKDKEFSNYRIDYFVKRKTKPLTDVDGLRERIIQRIMNNLFASRYQEIARGGKLPYLGTQVSSAGFLAGIETLNFSVSLSPEKWEEGFKAAWKEFIRAQRHGFTADEFDDAKDRLKTQMRVLRQESDKIESGTLVEKYVQHFLQGDTYMSYKDELDLQSVILDKISAADVHTYLKTFAAEPDRIFMVMAADKQDVFLPTQQDLQRWTDEIAATEPTPYVRERAVETLMQDLPQAGKVVEEKDFKDLSLVHWKLNNGVHVYVKPTDFKNDEILFSAYSPGGSSLYEDVDYHSAMNAPAFVSSSGLGNLNANQLSQFLNAKAVQVIPYIGEREEGFSGASIGKDLEAGLGMLHLYMTKSRLDTSRYNVILERARTAMRNRTVDPNRAFADTLNNVLGNYHYRRQPTTLATFDKIDSSRVKEIFDERFANAADFTFLFVGNVNVDSLRQLTAKYLGSLPANKSSENARDLNIRIPKGSIRKDLLLGQGDKGTVQLVFSDDYVYNDQNNISLDALKALLDFRLIERLRKKESGVYSPSVRLTKSKFPQSVYSITIAFGCDPERKDELIKAVEEEMRLIKSNGMNATELSKFKAEEARVFDLQLKSNDFWLSYIKGQLTSKEPLSDVLTYPQLLKDADLTKINTSIKKLINLKNQIVVTLGPVK